MTEQVIRRIPDVKTLFDILPTGAEGGKEFARIVDLLLFHQARSKEKNITIFSDAAGDYRGLDSFEGDAFRIDGTTGYQYKFYPSSISQTHRRDIEKSLKRVMASEKELNLKKWVLVTPQDFTEPANRRSKGDVGWFAGLKQRLGIEFEIEHWGHRQLTALFLEAPTLCLYYYPELVREGTVRKKSIRGVRSRYDAGLLAWYQNIEFVGMSVYKVEATKGVPMEHIYIPLTAVPHGTSEDDDTAPRINPLKFLPPGMQSVVLGDPGSGKSTLLRFLALVGTSDSLQKRSGAPPDDRLPIIVTLRRYADELKSRGNLSLIDYILENVQTDLSLKDADIDFFEYYLDTGHAILLFDGLDEVGNPHLKQTVRNRIRTLLTSYPGNTAIVTSRIVGYGDPFAFDQTRFAHCRLAKLRLPEIRQFVSDWYAFRVENARERKMQADDLIRIVEDREHRSIRELAENPLLLTIIALVHRIDAVLPDDRIVLYEKCTETLLNTWHTWKFREIDAKNRGKVERRNRRRLQEIAYWMHCRSVETGRSQRAVVPYEELQAFLSRHIETVEHIADDGEDANELADDFLKFVKARAGLLIEVGDNQYSFVHLTFQEYLAATRMATVTETDGAAGTWKAIKTHCEHPNWHEVIRLLIAGLKSETSQQFLIDSILSTWNDECSLAISRLLGGLLMDGIDPAERKMEGIMSYLLRSISSVQDTEDPRPVVSLVRSHIGKHQGGANAVSSCMSSLLTASKGAEQSKRLALTAYTTMPTDAESLMTNHTNLMHSGDDGVLVRLLLSDRVDDTYAERLRAEYQLLWSVQALLGSRSGASAHVAAALQVVTCRAGLNVLAETTFVQLLTLLAFPKARMSAFVGNLWEFALGGLPERTGEPPSGFSYFRISDTIRRAVCLEQGRPSFYPLVSDRLSRAILCHDEGSDVAGWLDTAYVPSKKPLSYAYRAGGSFAQPSTARVVGGVCEILCRVFSLRPAPLWVEAIRNRMAATGFGCGFLFDPDTWHQVEDAFRNGYATETDQYFAAWVLFLDLWLSNRALKVPEALDPSRLVELTASHPGAPVRIAHCVRECALGGRSAREELAQMIASDDPAFRRVFEACLWLQPQTDMLTAEDNGSVVRA